MKKNRAGVVDAFNTWIPSVWGEIGQQMAAVIKTVKKIDIYQHPEI